MKDLRERLMDTIGVLDTDPALEVFASWLRERADQLMPVLFTPRQLLGILADEISPTHDEGQTP